MLNLHPDVKSGKVPITPDQARAFLAEAASDPDALIRAVQAVDALELVQTRQDRDGKVTSARLSRQLDNKTQVVASAITREPTGALTAISGSASAYEGTLALPNPEARRDRVEGAALGYQPGFSDSTLTTAIMSFLDDAGMSRNTSQSRAKGNAEIILHELKDSGWLESVPKPVARKFRGEKHILAYENAIRDMVDLDTHQGAPARNKRGHVLLSSYNSAVSTSQIADTGIRESNPFVMSWIRRFPEITGSGDAGKIYEHPGELVGHVRSELENYGLHKKSWRKISQLNDEQVSLITRPPFSRQNAAIILNSIATYQITDPNRDQILTSRDFLRQVTSRGGRLFAPGGGGNDTAERVVGLILRGDQSEWETPEARRDAMGNLADYVRNSAQNDDPIRSTNFSGLMAASHRWHRDAVHREMQAKIEEEKARNEGRIRVWNTLVGPQNYEITDAKGEPIKGKLTPLVSIPDLYAEGKEMSHCVGTHGTQCVDGRARIFSIESEGGERVTFEMTHDGGRWRLNEIKGPHNQPVPRDSGSYRLAEKTVRDYQAAWDEATKDERSKTEWLLPEEAVARFRGALPEPEPEPEPEPAAGGEEPDRGMLEGQRPEPERPALDLGDVPQAAPPPNEFADDINAYVENRAREDEANRRVRANEAGGVGNAQPQPPAYRENRQGRGGQEFRNRG